MYVLLFDIAFSIKTPQYYIENPSKYQKLGLLRWEDGKDHSLPQDFADMLGWKEMASKVDSIYSTFPNKDKTLILCDNYGQAGAINYYTKHNIKAVSFSADYINWFDLNTKYENLIRIKGDDIEGELKGTSPFFQKAIISDSITNKYAREFGTTIFAFTGAKIDIRERLKNEIDEQKNYR